MPRIRRACRAAAMLAALALCAGAAIADASSGTPEEVQGGSDSATRLTVPVTINGGGPYHFVVDTGAERTVISRELAERLTLSPSTPVRLLSVSGVDQVETAMVDELRLSSSRNRLSDLQAPLLPEYHLGAAGMLGTDSLQTKRVVLDFDNMRMSISDAPRPAIADTDEIVITARHRFGQLVLIDADADGQKIRVIIDTGSQVTIGNPALRRILTRRGRLGQSRPIDITSVTGGVTAADYTHVRRIRIGGVTMVDMPIAFADPLIFQRLGLDRNPALLLGMDALRLFGRVSIDFANRDVRFILKGGALRMPPRLAGASMTGRG